MFWYYGHNLPLYMSHTKQNHVVLLTQLDQQASHQKTGSPKAVGWYTALAERKNYKPTILYPVKLYFKNEEIKTFLNNKNRGSVTSSPTLYKIIQWKREETRQLHKRIQRNKEHQ